MMQTGKETKKDLKKALRKEIKALRAAHTDEQIHELSLGVRDQVLTLPEYREAEVIYAYVDCKHEVETSDIIRAAWADGKKSGSAEGTGAGYEILLHHFSGK